MSIMSSVHFNACLTYLDGFSTLWLYFLPFIYAFVSFHLYFSAFLIHLSFSGALSTFHIFILSAYSYFLHFFFSATYSSFHIQPSLSFLQLS